MLKVLSTKLTVDEWDRFTIIAKQKGKTKSELLRKVALDCKNDVARVDGTESVGNPHPAVPSKKDLVKEDQHVVLIPSSTEILRVNRDASEGKPETRSKFSIGLGLLLLVPTFLLWLQSQPSKTTDDQPVFDSSLPYFDVYGKCIYPIG